MYILNPVKLTQLIIPFFILLLSGCDGNSQIFLSTVDAAKKDIHRLQISANTDNTIIETNEEVQLTVTAFNANNLPVAIDADKITWSLSCSEQGCATINKNGKLTGIANGEATVTANYGGISSNLTLTISSAKLVSLSITAESTPFLCQSVALKASGEYEDNSIRDVTATSNWSIQASNDAAQVLKTQNGDILFSTSNDQPATILVTHTQKESDTNITGTLTIQVADNTPPNITIAGESTLFQGVKSQYTALGEFSDGTSQDLTYNVKWSSADDNKLSFSSATTAFELMNRQDGLAIANNIGSNIVVNANCGLQTSNDLVINIETAEVTGITILREDATDETSPFKISVSEEPVTFKAFAQFNNSNQPSNIDITEECRWSINDGITESIYVGNTEQADVTKERRGNITGLFKTPDGKNTEVKVQYDIRDSSGNRPEAFFQVIVE